MGSFDTMQDTLGIGKKEVLKFYNSNLLPFYHYKLIPFYNDNLAPQIKLVFENVPYLNESYKYIATYLPSLPEHPGERLQKIYAKLEYIKNVGASNFIEEVVLERAEECAAKEGISAEESKLLVACLLKREEQNVDSSFAKCMNVNLFNALEKIAVAEGLASCAIDKLNEKMQMIGSLVTQVLEYGAETYNMAQEIMVKAQKISKQLENKVDNFKEYSSKLAEDKSISCLLDASKNTNNLKDNMQYFIQCIDAKDDKKIVSLLSSINIVFDQLNQKINDTISIAESILPEQVQAQEMIKTICEAGDLGAQCTALGEQQGTIDA